MTPFTELLGALLILLLTAAGLVVHGDITITLRRRPKPRKEAGRG